MHGTQPASSTVTTDNEEARRRLAAAAQRSAQLIRSLDQDQPVDRSEWTVGETAAHLVIALRGFTDSVLGDDREWRSWETQIPDARAPERVKILNRAMLAAEPRRRPDAAARAITDGASAFLAATESAPPDCAVPTPWYGPHESLTVAQATCLLLGEQIMHGLDVARTVRRPWPISKPDALLIFEAGRQMMPRVADPAAIGDRSATYEVRLGRTVRFVVRVADGSVTVEPETGQRIDCHVLAEPVALLLLAYGRSSQWRAIGRAKMITWGPKPWLAFQFASFFSNP